MTREALMRHDAVGITAQAFPKMVRLGGTDCQASYLHEPGDPKDGLTVTVPLFVLNQVSEDRAEWLVPGMLKDKIQALLKSLPQRPRSRFVPLPESAQRLATELSAPEVFGAGGLTDVLLKKARDETSLDIKRTDFKLDMLSAHFFMNFRVVDEHGRQLGHGGLDHHLLKPPEHAARQQHAHGQGVQVVFAGACGRAHASDCAFDRAGRLSRPKGPNQARLTWLHRSPVSDRLAETG